VNIGAITQESAMNTHFFDEEKNQDREWIQSVRDTISLTLFLALTFSGFALVQVVGMG
jgi:hypothetical protein